MMRKINEQWRRLWRTANDVVLAMDGSPLDDLYYRVRRLEAATFPPASENKRAEP
jgi:hypothetical protein